MNSDLSVSCSIFRRYFHWDSQEKRSFMYTMFFKPTLRLRNLWKRIRSRAPLIRNSIAELMFCYQHQTMSLNIPKYSCFKRILPCPTQYKTFWKLLNTKPKSSEEVVTCITPLCTNSAIRLSPAFSPGENTLKAGWHWPGMVRDGQVQLPLSPMLRTPGEDSNSATWRSCPWGLWGWTPPHLTGV